MCGQPAGGEGDDDGRHHAHHAASSGDRLERRAADVGRVIGHAALGADTTDQQNVEDTDDSQWNGVADDEESRVIDATIALDQSRVVIIFLLLFCSSLFVFLIVLVLVHVLFLLLVVVFVLLVFFLLVVFSACFCSFSCCCFCSCCCLSSFCSCSCSCSRSSSSSSSFYIMSRSIHRQCRPRCQQVTMTSLVCYSRNSSRRRSRRVVEATVALNQTRVVDAVDESIDAVAACLVLERVLSDAVPLRAATAAYQHLHSTTRSSIHRLINAYMHDKTGLRPVPVLLFWSCNVYVCFANSRNVK